MCQASLVFELPLERCVISGKILQNSCLEDETDQELQQLREQELLSSETDQIIQPLFTIIQRLTYEVTEITFDQPGIELNFVATVAE